MNTIQKQFNFRPVTYSKALALSKEVDGTVNVAEDFEVVEGTVQEPIKVKRKPVVATINMPEFYTDLPDDNVRDMVAQFVADYCKVTFIDQFLDVGAHDYAAILAEQAANSRGGSIAISDELLTFTATSFGRYIAEVTGIEKYGEIMAALLNAKCTARAFTTHLQSATEEAVDKIIAKVDEWFLKIGEEVTDPQELEDYTAGYTFVAAKLSATKKKVAVTSGDEILALL